MSSTRPVVPKLFQPIAVGKHVLAHRLVLAPLTRFRADDEHVPSVHAAEYYAQRASVPGTLLITEGTFPAADAGGLKYVPGIWSDKQVEAWKHVTGAVHERGSRIFCQLWALGRAGVDINPALLEEGHFQCVSASDVKLSTSSRTPRSLTIEEIREYMTTFETAALNAIRAGFDGVELHAGTGYLIDQFLQDVSNKRTDAYGGSIENRARFALEIAARVANAVGAHRTAIRLSPWSDIWDMRMEDPKPTFTHLVSQLAERHPDLAYIHVIEPRISGPWMAPRDVPPGENNGFLRDIWRPRPFISSGGHTRESAFEFAERGDLVAFGRLFISNPDLPVRIARDLPLAEGDRATYYGSGVAGYTDYPFADEQFSGLFPQS